MSALAFSTKEWERLAIKAAFQPNRMASMCGISLRQLEREFATTFRKTPTQWVREYRCGLGLKLIIQRYSTKAAAGELKFASASHFCHDFKKVYLSSPRRLAFVAPHQTHVANEQ
jgi:AraC-like DNA-binding protein